ncbi:MAG: phytanoyl-CoA dioxygenase family protein, partial [Caldilineaceae bacterium]|nr:phytanoyl-CoA dioxygenase family protein [Caldilineaceae bacterium]
RWEMGDGRRMINKKQVEQFDREGYLLCADLLTVDDLRPVIDAYEAHIDRRAHELHTAGKLSSTYAEEPFARRLASICQETGVLYPELDIMYMRDRALFDFLHHPKLLDLAEAFVGPEILCSPIQHVRPKLPSGLTPRGSDPHVVHWHQDAGVAWEEADPYFILTVWIPLVDATPENGCLRLIGGVHRDGLLPHRTKRGLGTAIHGDRLAGKSIVTLPMRKGSLLLMHKHTPHSSSRNTTDGVRWSMDLRYQATGTATGRPFHPAFVARSRRNPASVLTDYDEWCRRWAEALADDQGQRVHRWAEQ